MEGLSAELGVGAIFVLLVLKEIREHLKARGAEHNGSPPIPTYADWKELNAAVHKLANNESSSSIRLKHIEDELDKVRERVHEQSNSIQKQSNIISSLKNDLEKAVLRTRAALLAQSAGKSGADVIPPPELGERADDS